MIDKIMKKYINKYGFIFNLKELCLELMHNKIEPNKIYSIITESESKNKEIVKKMKLENKENEEKNKMISNITITEKNYSKNEEIITKNKAIQLKKTDVSFIIHLIDIDINNIYLFLPKSNDKQSINIIDLIITHYIKELNFYKSYYYACDKEEEKFISENIISSNDKISLLKKYKSELLLETKEEALTNKNVVSYFKNAKNIPYILYDIEKENPNFNVMCNLIESIEKGTFKNLKPFTNNDILKGIYEVRDLYNKTRVFFTIENGEYCVFYAIDSKSETNSIYKKKLEIRYKLFKDNKNSTLNCNVEKLIKKWGN